MKPSIRQVALAAIGLSLLLNGKPSHGEAEIPADHFGVMVHHSLTQVKFWVFAEHIGKWVPHVAEAKKGMVAVKCDYVTGNGPCQISFDEGRSPKTVQQTARYRVVWDNNTRQFDLQLLP